MSIDGDRAGHDRIEILGQTFSYPRTVWGTLSVAIVVAGICAVLWLALHYPKEVGDITRPFVIGRASNSTSEAEARYLIQFWTPSAKTKESPNVADWEKIDDRRLDDFADALLGDNEAKGKVTGYRRYDVIGKGLGGRTAGMWWVITVTNDYQVTDLVKLYHQFWHTDASVYVEVLHGGAAGKHFD
jgi:hypothetical protein